MSHSVNDIMPKYMDRVPSLPTKKWKVYQMSSFWWYRNWDTVSQIRIKEENIMTRPKVRLSVLFVSDPRNWVGWLHICSDPTALMCLYSSSSSFLLPVDVRLWEEEVQGKYWDSMDLSLVPWIVILFTTECADCRSYFGFSDSPRKQNKSHGNTWFYSPPFFSPSNLSQSRSAWKQRFPFVQLCLSCSDPCHILTFCASLWILPERMLIHVCLGEEFWYHLPSSKFFTILVSASHHPEIKTLSKIIDISYFSKFIITLSLSLF